MKCEFCQRIGLGLSVYLNRGESIPDEIFRFEVILDSYFGHSIIRCPQCHTYFKRERIIDNEIVYGFDVIEIEEISEERANELVQFENKEKKKFSREIKVHSLMMVCIRFTV